MQKFLKKNGYYVMLGVCILAIVSLIVVAIVSNSTIDELKNPDPTVAPTPVVSPTPTANPADVLPTAFVVPVADATVGLNYSNETFVFSETLNQWQTHAGVDFKTAESQDVFCIADGVIEFVSTDDVLNGGTVIVSHNGGLKSIYKSLGSELTVKEGDKVKAGDKLGMTSMSAYSEFKEGTHLHLEMTLNDEVADPNDYLSVK